MKIVFTAIAQGISSALPLLILPFFSYNNDLESYAEWGLYRLGIIVISIIMLSGVSIYNVKSIASGYKTNYRLLFLKYILPLHILIVIILLPLSNFLGSFLLFNVFLFSIANSFWVFLSSFYRGMDDFNKYNKLVLLESLIVFSITIITIKINLDSFYCWVVISLTKVVLGLILLSSLNTKILPRFEVSPPFFLKKSITLLPFALSNWVVSFLDRFIIGFFMNSTELAYYVSRYDSSMIGGFFVTILTLYFLPKLCAGEISSNKFIKYTVFFSPILFLVSYIFSVFYLYLTGVSGFENLFTDILVVLINLSFSFYYFYTVTNNILIANSKEYYLLKSTFLLLVLNVLLTSLFVFFFGLIGAIVAKILSLVIVLLINFFVVFRGKIGFLNSLKEG